MTPDPRPTPLDQLRAQADAGHGTDPAEALRETARQSVTQKMGPLPTPTDDQLDEAQRDEDAREQFQLMRDQALARGEGAAGDRSPFINYCREISRQSRRDNVVAMARVLIVDPTWPGTTSKPLSRQTSAEHLRSMAVRPFLLQALRQLWDEYDAQVRRAAKKAKSRQARAARKQTRQKQKKR